MRFSYVMIRFTFRCLINKSVTFSSRLIKLTVIDWKQNLRIIMANVSVRIVFYLWYIFYLLYRKKLFLMRFHDASMLFADNRSCIRKPFITENHLLIEVVVLCCMIFKWFIKIKFIFISILRIKGKRIVQLHITE